MINNGVASEYEMRPATPEERKAVQDYIDSISVETGFNIYDLQEQVKIYDAYYNKGFAAGIKILNKLDWIITEQLDQSDNQVECQTLRWVLDKISELL